LFQLENIWWKSNIQQCGI